MQNVDRFYFICALIGAFANIIASCAGFAVILPYRIPNERNQMKKIAIVLTGVMLVAFLTITSLLYAEDAFKNEQITRKAWHSLEQKDYKSSIARAEECIRLFQEEAIDMQNELEKMKAPFPALGKGSDAEKKAIFNRGLLNDVGACWLILGKANRALNDNDKAEKALKKAMVFTYARCFNPSSDEFWSPAVGAKKELDELQGRSIYD